LGSVVTDLTADLANYGFVPGDTIPMISVCRDEITRPLVDAFEVLWGNSFSLGSIAAMIFCGTTGFSAGMHHSPVVNGTDRFLFIVCPHIAISDQGVVGKVWRPGVPTISTACGSLAGFLTELQSGIVNFELSTTDLEQTMMKGQMSTYFTYGSVPTLDQLTKDAATLILNQLTTTLATFNLSEANYAVLSGVQVHGPNAQTFFCPASYFWVDEAGVNTTLDMTVLGAGAGAAQFQLIAEEYPAIEF